MKMVLAGLAVMIIAVAVLGVQQRQASQKSDEKLRNAAVMSCTRGLLERAENITADADFVAFARDAATARRADGNNEAANKYDASADRAQRRMRSRQARLLGANVEALLRRNLQGLPSSEALDEAYRACSRIY